MNNTEVFEKLEESRFEKEEIIREKYPDIDHFSIWYDFTGHHVLLDGHFNTDELKTIIKAMTELDELSVLYAKT